MEFFVNLEFGPCSLYLHAIKSQALTKTSEETLNAFRFMGGRRDNRRK
ncbi:MAG: hypothetical protein WKF36_11245 [Candidatus Nitrosocosmicus sp.]